MGHQRSTSIKICGITDINQAKAITEIGVEAIGVIGVEGSPRFVTEQKRRELFAQIHCSCPNVDRVWVIADLNDAEIDRGIQEKEGPTVVQLHGKESQSRCKELRNKYPNIQWWKAIRIQKPEDLEKTNLYQESVDALLLDAWSSKGLGGSGKRLPLEWIRQAKLNLPWWLAGGISAEWIEEVFKHVDPFGLDASSRLEIEPGVKDLKLVRELVEEVRRINNLK